MECPSGAAPIRGNDPAWRQALYYLKAKTAGSGEHSLPRETMAHIIDMLAYSTIN
jgi:hypothetical protein